MNSWHAAGRLWDVMNELSSVSTPLSEFSLPPSAKRTRSPDRINNDNGASLDSHVPTSFFSQDTTIQFTGLPDALSLNGVPDDMATGPNHHGYGPYLDVDALMASIASGYDLSEHAQAP